MNDHNDQEYLNDYADDHVIMGINYAVKQGWLDKEQAEKMDKEEMVGWLSEHIR